tara:strand:+ start:714 stop:1139 length:426 start_codon:yes stop_codon:yes gene_type:complete
MENKKYTVNYKITINEELVEEKKGFTLISDHPDNIDGINILLSEFDNSNLTIHQKESLVKKTSIPPSLAYGKHNKNLMGTVPKTLLYKDCKVGDYVLINLKDDTTRRGEIKKVKKESVIVDCNHPLVDKTLDLELEIIDIK